MELKEMIICTIRTQRFITGFIKKMGEMSVLHCKSGGHFTQKIRNRYTAYFRSSNRFVLT